MTDAEKTGIPGNEVNSSTGKKSEKIGNVTLDYTYYPGEDFYCDGAVEDEILDIVKNHPASEFDAIIRERKEWPVLYHLSSIRENIVDWIPTAGDEKVLEIGAGPGAITGALAANFGTVDCVELSRKRSLINAYRHKDADNLTIHVGNFEDIEPHLDNDYDYIFLIGVLEYAGCYIHCENPYREELRRMLAHLKPETGRIIIAIENRLGLKYFAGCAEDHSGRYFDGIESYDEGGSPAETFTRPALEKMFHELGVEEYSFYYPYPDYKFMDTLYSDIRQPSASELSENIRNFDRDRLLLFDERRAYKGITEDGLYPVFANSYCIVLGPKFDAVYCKYSVDRDPKYRIRTEIFAHVEDRKVSTAVTKYPMGDAAVGHVEKMERSCRLLKDRYEKKALQAADSAASGAENGGIIMQLQTILQIAPCWKTEDGRGMVFPYVQGKPLSQLLDAAIGKDDKEGFLYLLSEYKRRVGMYPEEQISDYDMTFSNIIVNGEVWTAIDYEWARESSLDIRDQLVRSLILFFRHDRRRQDKVDVLVGHEELLSFLGVTDDEFDAFEDEEDEIQKKVTGGITALGELRAEMGAQVIKPAQLQSKEEIIAASEGNNGAVNKLTSIMVYFDTGRGFNEEESLEFDDKYRNEGIALISFIVRPEVRRLRLDPANCPVIAYLRNVWMRPTIESKPDAAEDGEYLASCSDKTKEAMCFDRYMKTCGEEIAGKAIVFTTSDPNMEWDMGKIRKKTGVGRNDTLQITMAIQMTGLPSTMAAALDKK